MMTKVTYIPSEYSMTVKGHAGAGAAGSDIVCAAVSALSFALIGAATEKPSYMANIYMCRKDAEVRVRCYPEPRYKSTCKEMFRTILTGFENLREEYPDHIKIIMGGYEDG